MQISVLVPCFRSVRFVGRALDSLLAQTVGTWEAIVVDNASDDGTFQAAQRYEEQDSRIRVFRNESNIGPVRNWRRCGELSGGLYAGLLFSDDWYDPSFLEEALPWLADPEVGFVFGAVQLEVEAAHGTRPVRTAYRLKEPGKHAVVDYLRPMLEDAVPRVPVSPGCAIMRRRDLVRWLRTDLPDEELGHLQHGAGQDLNVYLQACAEYPAFAHLNEPRVHFLAHSGNLSWKRQVDLAYASAIMHFVDSGVPHGVSEQRALAKLWWRFRHDGRRAKISFRLRPTGWLRVIQLAASAVARRISRLTERAHALLGAASARRSGGLTP